MTPQLSRREFVVCLIELINVALARGLHEDAAGVLTGVRVLRPKLAELDLLEGWVAIKSGLFREGIQVLHNLESSPTQWSMAKAMMATCQHFLNDPEWQISANEVLEGDATPDAVSMVKDLQNKGRKKEEPAFADDAESAAVAQLPFQPGIQYASFAFHLRA